MQCLPTLEESRAPSFTRKRNESWNRMLTSLQGHNKQVAASSRLTQASLQQTERYKRPCAAHLSPASPRHNEHDAMCRRARLTAAGSEDARICGPAVTPSAVWKSCPRDGRLTTMTVPVNDPSTSVLITRNVDGRVPEKKKRNLPGKSNGGCCQHVCLKAGIDSLRRVVDRGHVDGDRAGIAVRVPVVGLPKRQQTATQKEEQKQVRSGEQANEQPSLGRAPCIGAWHRRCRSRR